MSESEFYADEFTDAEAGQDPAFKAVLIYENVAAGARARWFLERLARASSRTLEEQMWNFDVLGIREVRNRAASAARRADVVAVSASGQREFPGAVRAWLDMWLWLLEDENPALLALFDSLGTPTVASICAYLSCVTQRAGIEFLSAHRPDSLFPVVRPKEEAIWPGSVERASLPSVKSRGRVWPAFAPASCFPGGSPGVNFSQIAKVVRSSG